MTGRSKFESLSRCSEGRGLRCLLASSAGIDLLQSLCLYVRCCYVCECVCVCVLFVKTRAGESTSRLGKQRVFQQRCGSQDRFPIWPRKDINEEIEASPFTLIHNHNWGICSTISRARKRFETEVLEEVDFVLVLLTNDVCGMRDIAVSRKIACVQTTITGKISSTLVRSLLSREAGGRKKTYLKSTPDRDSNLDLPVIGSIVFCETSALDHAVTKAGFVRSIDRRCRLKFKKWRRRAMEKEGGDGGGEKGGGQQDAASLLDAASLFGQFHAHILSDMALTLHCSTMVWAISLGHSVIHCSANSACGTLVHHGDELGVPLGHSTKRHVSLLNKNTNAVDTQARKRTGTTAHRDYLHLIECVIASIRLSGYPATPQHDAVASGGCGQCDTGPTFNLCKL
uniref:Uncharacterized protein n=1 Tax=Timema genevievae TaxID=629358 RepID=A0A7R9PPD3_TIMGE|nr:unnamed protein product [Timema genevievae]